MKPLSITLCCFSNHRTYFILALYDVQFGYGKQNKLMCL